MIPEAASAAIRKWLARADAQFPRAVEGVYVGGSIALGDFHSGASDVDVVAVCENRLLYEALDKAAAEAGGKRRGTLVPEPFLQVRAITPDGAASLGAVDQLTLRRYGLVVRGPAPDTFVPDVTHAELVHAMVRNLDEYWAPWLARASRLRGRVWRMHPERIMWGALGVPRQHFSVVEGDVTSKSAAGRYVRERFDDRWHRIIDEALRLREGAPGRLYRSPLGRSSDMLAFLDHAIGRTRAAAAASR